MLDHLLPRAVTEALNATVRPPRTFSVPPPSLPLPSSSASRGTRSAAAQGGMQASLANVVKGQGDNEDVHFEDTVRGSDWGADQRVVRMFVDTAPKAVRELGATQQRAHTVDLDRLADEDFVPAGTQSFVLNVRVQDGCRGKCAFCDIRPEVGATSSIVFSYFMELEQKISPELGATLLFAIAQLLSPPATITGGSVRFHGNDLVAMTESELCDIRWRDYSVVMQSAMNALNPVKTIGAQFKDAMRAHGKFTAEDIAARSAEVLKMVGIDPVHLGSYPHQLSGGMRQRSMIAMALLFTPDLVIMDEPTSALDVVAQRSLMVQIKELQLAFGFAVIFVTHDMSLISHFSDRLMVMYAGQVDELGATKTIFDRPLHPYTQGLLEAFPSIRGPRVPLKGIPGNPPDLSHVPSGCRFRPRCPYAIDKCAEVAPDLYPLDGALVRCLRREDGSLAS